MLDFIWTQSVQLGETRDKRTFRNEKLLFTVGFESSNGTVSSLRLHCHNHIPRSWLLWVKKLNVHVMPVKGYINKLEHSIGLTWCVLLSHFRDIASELFCRLINVDMLFLFLTIYIRYMTELHDNEKRCSSNTYTHSSLFIDRIWYYERSKLLFLGKSVMVWWFSTERK